MAIDSTSITAAHNDNLSPPTSPLPRKEPLSLNGVNSATGAIRESQPSTPTRPKSDHSGVTIPWTIDTKYYSVKVDFWIDETEAHKKAELEKMIEDGELDEMGAVVEAVIFCFSKNEPSTFYDIKPWLAFVERHEPSITLCVATGAPKPSPHQEERLNIPEREEVVDDYDEWCLGNGFEFVDLEDQPSNLTHDEHVGLDRIMEALAAHMWDGLKKKSSKKREQHDRSMMMSFRDDDIDMDSSWRGSVSRKSLMNLDAADLNLHDDIQEMDYDGNDDSEDEDEGDDKAFSRALQELNMHNRSASPTAPVPGPGISSSQSSLGVSSSFPDEHRASKNNDHGFDDEFGADGHEIKELEGDELSFWSSQDSTGRSDLIDRTLERQFKKFLGQPVDDSVTTSSEYGGKESSGELDSSLEKDFSSFELNEDGEFEFGDFVVSEGPGGEELEDLDINFGVRGMSTPNQESIRSMHRALFANIDDEEGMAQTIATLQGLREQGKAMSENDRRELAARVALSFGMQMGE
ncbi:hypothetical protein BCR41DRAFT_371353 [Lobosporangium transversale]|uniref:Alpha and gamma adaptin binding protein p34-domain-containing protein n=1 Tax=Lobosporangium transversale TaxID=64571 RepID=A0A1Y2GKU3_9FUNG|nr:hypothetical protein BCR41DRAFT_371353 [Lobosporangium transversale]ORZ13832.1 hypothetical protein BCR41DRAFT_371353 [Lobosporangium transversale]|eukprot:XP_021880616.1 hypothetical protein BCR41DRAFT_371353 [Lobosporangium transversale]